LNSYIIETIYGQELEGEYNSRRLRPFTAPKGSSLEAYETVQKAGATDEEALAASGPVILEATEPSREEEGVARETEEKRRRSAKAKEDDWTDEEKTIEEDVTEGGIGERLRARKARAQATRTSP
jgi:hypothetical protein